MVDLGRSADGSRRRVTRSGFASKHAALEALRQCLDDARGGVDVEMRATIGEYLDEWIASKRSLRPSTQHAYASHIRLYLKPLLGDVPLRDLRPRQIDLMLGELSRPRPKRSLTPATVRRVYSTLRVALNDAVRRRIIAYNPAQFIELPSERRLPPTVWTAEQAAAFLGSVRADRLYAMYHLVIVTGLRRGEVCALRWADVDLDRGLLRVTQSAVEFGSAIHVGPPKTRAGARTVPLDEFTVALLRLHRDRQDSERRQWAGGYADAGLVFARENGTMLRPEGVSRRFRDATRRAGLPIIRFHDLRHTSASLALAAGVAMKVVSDRLGHSTIGITADLYTHVVPVVARDAAESIAAVLRIDPPSAPTKCQRDVSAEAPNGPSGNHQQKGA